MDLAAVSAFAFESESQVYAARDAMLYALALGFGEQPTDPDHLRFTFEKGARPLDVVPTMAVTLGATWPWYTDEAFGFDWKRMLHGEERLEILAPLPPAAKIRGRRRFGDIVDRGEKGAVLYLHREITDEDSGTLLARTTSTMMMRGDGGCGGTAERVLTPHAIPERAPDVTVAYKTLPQQALLYRLCGDVNPLHADPAVAEAAGFRQPILHGLCTFGHAGRAVLDKACGFDPARLAAMQVRFSSPVYPGETLQTQLWLDEAEVSFRTRVAERDIVVIDNGRATLRR